MILDGMLFPLKKWELHISEKDGFCWPTPAKNANQDCPSERRRKTSALESAVKMFPTPTAMPYGNNQGGAQGRIGKVRPSLQSIAGGKLNPQWVEWLMNYKIGWTELNAVGMQWYQFKQKKRLKD